MSTKNRILIVEDDKNIARLMEYNLSKAGFECALAHNGQQAFSMLEQQNFGLIVLDLMLPEIDGLELCRLVKKNQKLAGIPVVMVTAKGDEMDRVVGFELGADDYIVKPFSPRELVLRVRAILKRSGGARKQQESATGTIRAGTLEIDLDRHKITNAGEELELTLTEFKLLLTLVQRRGRVQSREKLLSDVWDIDSDITTRTIDTHVKRLRQKLGNMGQHIETVRGIGYRFSEID